MPPGCPVTIVIITRDRPAELRKTLLRLAALPERPAIIVVDNGSSDPVSVPEGEIRAIRLDRNAGAAGRNVGVARASTPYVAFCDDDSCWAPAALTRAAKLFERHPKLGLIAARVLVGADERLDPICREMEESPLPHDAQLPGPGVLGFMACGAVVRRSVFLEAGGFHERFGVGGEEQLVAIDLARRGWQLAYCDDVLAHHYPAAGGDRPGRQARLVRNNLWTAWLRYQARDALGATEEAVKRAFRSSAARAGLTAATLGMPWVLRERDEIDMPLQRRVRLLAK
jgi:GT2 family glycosyltransferase